jgi:iron complex outermembrane receptor protein
MTTEGNIMSKTIKALCLASVACAGLMAAQPVFAADDDSLVEEVIVTASKREERVRDVAGDVSAVTGEQLQKIGAQSLADYITKLPGVAFNDYQPGVSEVIIRGISATTYHEQGQTVVGYYINEIPLSEAGWPVVIPDVDAFDLNRVEVLRGPQGTLFGAAALGGLVNYIANEADVSDFDAAAEASIGKTKMASEANYTAKGMLNIPLIKDKLAIRVVGLQRYDAGYLDNIGTGTKDSNNLLTQGGRVSLVFKPVEGTKISLMSMAQEMSLDDGTYVYRGSYKRSTKVLEPHQTNLWLNSARLDQDLGFADLTLLVAQAKKRGRVTFDASDTGYLQGFSVPADSISHVKSTAEHYEARLASKSDQRFRWLLGATYYTSKKTGRDVVHQEGAADFIDANPGSFGGLSGAVLAPNDVFNRYFYGQTNKDWGLFGEVSFDFTPELTLTVGGRYFKTEAVTYVTRPPFANFPGDFSGLESTFVEPQKETGFNPKVTLQWKPHEGLMAYATYSEGFRVGGANPNPPSLTGGAPTTYDSDSLKNYEIGLRADLLDKRLLVDVTAFHLDWDNMQVRLFTPAPYYFAYVTNAGGSTVDGVELSSSFRVTPDFDLQGNVTYQDAKVSEFVPYTFAVGGGYPEGTVLPGASKWALAGTATWRLPQLPFTPRLEVAARYSSKAPVAFGSVTERGGYTIVDMRASFQLREDLTALLYVNNVFDKYGIVNAPFGDFYPIPLGSATKPRAFGVRFNWNY